MTYRDGVYDVTEYLEKHPGGKLILQAAGGPVDEWPPGLTVAQSPDQGNCLTLREESVRPGHVSISGFLVRPEVWTGCKVSVNFGG